jgi:hypothetical protein
MIARTWHGNTSKRDATIYEDLLEREVFFEIEMKRLAI